ncbi:MAG: hypothetical protein ACLFWL_18035 [Candidatus Brocadiia bacterium]
MRSLSLWDLALVMGVASQATILAYTFNPRWKALIYALPVPFTLASLALGIDINATHIGGLFLLLLYIGMVYCLQRKVNVPVVPSIIVSALTYVALGLLLAQHVPKNEAAFRLVLAAAVLVGIILHFSLPFKEEPGHRTSLPLHLKLPIILCVVGGLVILKRYLQGFMTVFPMIGVIAAYEARHSLWTLARQIPALMFSFSAMIGVAHFLQPHIGLGPALLLGWPVHLLLLTVSTRSMWRRMGKRTMADDETKFVNKGRQNANGT